MQKEPLSSDPASTYDWVMGLAKEAGKEKYIIKRFGTKEQFLASCKA